MISNKLSFQRISQGILICDYKVTLPDNNGNVKKCGRLAT